MAVTVGNLIMGPGTMYTGDFGATEPADALINASPAASAWTDVGGTMDGVELAITQEYTELNVDQIVDIPGRRLTKRDFTVKTNLAEPTLEHLDYLMNSATGGVTTGSGFKSLEPDVSNSATQPNYKAFIFDGFAPSSLRRRVIGRKMLNVEDISFAYKKDEQTVFTVSLSGHYVSSVIKPFKVVDGTE